MPHRFRHIIPALLAALAAISVQAQSGLRLNPTTVDFGWVPPNATLVSQVWAMGSTEDTVELGPIKTGCGCLLVKPTSTEILPGDSLLLSCYWQTRGLEGSRTVSAYLYSGPGGRPVELVIRGKVVTDNDSTASLDWRPRRLEFGRASGGRKNQAEQVITLTNRTQSALTMTLAGVGPELDVSLPESIVAGESARIGVAVSEIDPESDFETSFTLEFSGNAGESFRVSIPVVCGDFSFRPDFTTTKQ